MNVIPAKKYNARCFIYRNFMADNLLDKISIFHGRPVLTKLLEMNITPLSFQDKLITIRLRISRARMKFFLRRPNLQKLLLKLFRDKRNNLNNSPYL